jgi:hypothetical protein
MLVSVIVKANRIPWKEHFKIKINILTCGTKTNVDGKLTGRWLQSAISCFNLIERKKL